MEWKIGKLYRVILSLDVASVDPKNKCELLQEYFRLPVGTVLMLIDIPGEIKKEFVFENCIRSFPILNFFYGEKIVSYRYGQHASRMWDYLEEVNEWVV